MTITEANLQAPENKCLYILKGKGKWGLKDILKPFNAIYNGAGWFVEDKHLEDVRKICEQADTRYFDWHLEEGKTFKDLKRQYNLAFFQEKVINARMRVDSLKAMLGLSEINIENLLAPQRLADFERIDKGQELIEALAELERWQGQIKRAKEDERIAKIRVTPQSGFNYLLENCSEQKMAEELKATSSGVHTGFTIGEVDLKIPGGAISIVALPTGHGKTSTLINYSLGALKHKANLSVVFFTYEENASSILTLFLNSYVNKHLSKNNRESIKSYFREGVMQYIHEEERSSFLNAKQTFFNDLIDTGRLKVFYSDMTVEELVISIKFLKEKTNVELICIDYMQLLKMTNGSQGRQEQLKEICLILKNCAVDTGLPILLGAQFNRTVVAEADLSPTAIGEAGDIERVASLLIGGWNRNYEGFSREGNRDKQLKRVSKEPAIYFEILKGRGLSPGLSSVMDFNGNTGVLTSRLNPSRANSQQTVSF